MKGILRVEGWSAPRRYTVGNGHLRFQVRLAGCSQCPACANRAGWVSAILTAKRIRSRWVDREWIEIRAVPSAGEKVADFLGNLLDLSIQEV